MKIILTDVTYMHGDHVCTAGWGIEEERMIRPLLPRNAHWTTAYVGPNFLHVGNVLEFEPAQNRAGSFPHATEDYAVLNDQPYLLRKIEPERIMRTIGGLSTSPETVFRGNLQNRKFVNPDVNCPSLGAIDIPCGDIEFVESYGKLKATFSCRGREYEWIPVTGISLRDLWTQRGVNCLNRFKIDKTRAYIRLGLARAFVRDGLPCPCYMMVNNVLFY
jgi:hypothetical protein